MSVMELTEECDSDLLQELKVLHHTDGTDLSPPERLLSLENRKYIKFWLEQVGIHNKLIC